MPAQSQAQRAYLNAQFGHDWVKKHHFDNKGKLPEHKHESKAAQLYKIRITRPKT